MTDTIYSFTGKYAFLSNFYPVEIEYEGIKYPSTEHAYQAAKTLDPEIRKQCLGMTAGQAKRWGRKIPMRPDWEEIKNLVMRSVLDVKFVDHQSLQDALLETGSAELIEGNNWGDVYWGQVNGQGKNMLGKILMELRGDLRVLPYIKAHS